MFVIPLQKEGKMSACVCESEIFSFFENLPASVSSVIKIVSLFELGARAAPIAKMLLALIMAIIILLCVLVCLARSSLDPPLHTFSSCNVARTKESFSL